MVGGGYFLKGCNLAPRGVVNMLRETAGGLLLSSPRLLRANSTRQERKRPPLAEKLR